MIDEIAAIKLYGGVIHYDEASGYAGSTVYPIGTADRPVNNPVGLIALLAARPYVKTVYVHGDISLAAGNHFTGIHFIGSGPGISDFNALNANIPGCIIEGFTPTIDTETGAIIFKNCGNCALTTVTGNTEFENCGDLTFGGIITGTINAEYCGAILGVTVTGAISVKQCGNVTITTIVSLLAISCLDINLTTISGNLTVRYSGNVTVINCTSAGQIKIRDCHDVTIGNSITADQITIINCNTIYIPNESGGATVSIQKVKDVTLSAITGTYTLYQTENVSLDGIVDAGATVDAHEEGDIDFDVDVTCTAGTATIYGFARVTDGGGGMTVNDATETARTGLSTFGQETTAAIDVDGVNWKTLLAITGNTKPAEIGALHLTKGGVWAGLLKVRILDGDGQKIYPCGTELIEGTDFIDNIIFSLNPGPMFIPTLKGYTVQFRSTNAGDGAGETCTLTELQKNTRG